MDGGGWDGYRVGVFVGVCWGVLVGGPGVLVGSGVWDGSRVGVWVGVLVGPGVLVDVGDGVGVGAPGI